jgi:hypothetical protein
MSESRVLVGQLIPAADQVFRLSAVAHQFDVHSAVAAMACAHRAGLAPQESA